jgi:3-oxoadipate enol-lactonase
MTALSTRAISTARRTSALFCATFGSGQPLLLIHGFGASGALFQPLIPALALRHTVIVPDLRGHGNSRRLPLADGLARFAADLDDLLDLLRVGPAFVIGHAAGAAIAQQLALDCPTRVAGLVLVSATACGATSRVRPAERIRSGLAGLVSRSGSAGDYTAEAGERLIQSFDSRPWLGQLDVPALVVAGAADTVAPPQQAREIASRLPFARLEIIPNAGHWLIQTHPERLLDVTLRWLREESAA